MNRVIPVAAALLLASNGAFAWGGGCAFQADRNLDVAAQDLAAIKLLARAGDLEVEGDPGLLAIEVRGKACASDESLLADIQLVSRRDGNRQVIEAVMPESGGWGSQQAWMDLVVRVPARLNLQLEDSSGDVQIEGVAALEASDSSGDFSARDIAGNVRVNDSSGDLNLRGIGGSVTISNDSSGDITINDVQGDAIVEVDSSGGIVLRNVRGNAIVNHDSSGDILFKQIGGNAEVGTDSSGDIDADEVAMAFVVKHDTSGDIAHQRVAGRVEVPLQD